MQAFILDTWHFFETHFAWLLALGFSATAVYHARGWHKDRQRLTQIVMQYREIPPTENMPLVSILVPAWNEAGNVEACIHSILALRYPNKELILCAGGKDGTYEVVESFASSGVMVLAQMPGEGKQRVLQRCFEKAQGQVIFLTDADCILEDRVFESTLYPILMEGKEVTTGTWRPFNRSIQNPLVQFQWSHHLYREAWLLDTPATFDGRNAAIRREVIESAAPFMGDAPTGTDYVQSKTITLHGYQVYLVRGSRVQTEYPETIKEYWKQLSRWFRTSLLMGKRWDDRDMMKSALMTGVNSLLLLLSIPILYNRVLLIIWLTIVFHLSLTQLRLSDLARRYQDLSGHNRVNFRFLLIYLPIGWIGVVRGLFDSLFSTKRTRW